MIGDIESNAFETNLNEFEKVDIESMHLSQFNINDRRFWVKRLWDKFKTNLKNEQNLSQSKINDRRHKVNAFEPNFYELKKVNFELNTYELIDYTW